MGIIKGNWVTKIYTIPSKTNFYRRFKSACIVVFLPLLLNACVSEEFEDVPEQNQLEKPVKYISYLNSEQKAAGVLVKFTSNTGSKSRARSLNAAGLTATAQFPLVPGLTLAQTTPGLTINQTIANLSQDPNVAYAEPDYIVNFAATPNDTDFTTQWGLNNANDADIDAPEAWDIGKGNNSVVIAVIDSGVDYNHNDLASQIWSNPNEIPNNGIDDDRNGFVDDIHGWDFADNDNDPIDEHNHGTHVAGVIGAQTNNSRGVAGINWNVQIMALKFMNAQGAGSTSAAIQAIDYAVANGASISNNSWGGGGFSLALFDSIQAAYRRNHLFIAAAGNDGINTDTTAHYPSSYNLPNIISVAATDQQDQLASFSNFGRTSVDIAAPGFQIHSTIRNNQYQAFSGTSMASPFVAGVAGLLLGQNNTLTVSELKAAILDNADPVRALSGQIATGGRLNAFNSITGISSGAPTTPVAPVEISTPTTTTLSVGDTLQLSATGGDGTYTWTSQNPNRASINSTGIVTATGSGTASFVATDGAGFSSNPLILNINVPASATLILSPGNLTAIALNAITQLSVSGGTTPYTWTSSDSTVASITTSANTTSTSISANNPGSFRITVTDASGTTSSTGNINVSAPSLTLNANKSTLTTGENIQLTVSGGTSPYTWVSSNPAVASVDSGGLVRSLSTGLSSISVTDIIGASRSVNLQIISAPSGTLNVSPTDSVIDVGARTRLKATGGGATISWTSSAPAVASIDTRGIVTAAAEGVTQITAIDENGISGTTSIEIRTINITAAVLTIGAGDTLQLTAEGGLAPYQWKVSNSSVATISNSGLLTSNANGSVGGILVSVTDADNISKSVIVTVNNSTILRSPRAF